MPIVLQISIKLQRRQLSTNTNDANAGSNALDKLIDVLKREML